MIRLIAFDMDGTVLNEQKKITPKTQRALEYVAKKGIEIVPATGRPFLGLSEEIGKLQGVRYVLTTNGAGIYERDTGVCLHEESMPLEKFLPMLERLEKIDVMADSFVKGQAYMNQDKAKLIPHMLVSDAIKEYIRASRICVPCQSEFLRKKGDDIEKLTINFANEPDGSRRDYDKAWKIAEDYPEFNAVSGGMQNIEITKRKVSKASGLRWLGSFLGISMDEMLVFGDSGNDLTMIREAGTGVAMANGEKEVLEAADFVTRSNEEDGIVYALGKLFPQLLDLPDTI